MVFLRAPAKVNLYLHSSGRRGDGYHLLDSLMVPVSVGDRVSLHHAEGLSVTVSGPFAAAVEGENIVLKAVDQFAQYMGHEILVAIEIEKNIPVGAGLGGGSSDAAAVLKGLCQLFNVSLSIEQLAVMALRIGADVPFCVLGKPAYAAGIGEKLTPVSLPPMSILLVNAGGALLAKDVYTHAPLHYQSGMVRFDGDDIYGFLCHQHNVLEPNALALCPEIRVVLHCLADLADCKLVRMTGSGVTCFGLFESEGSCRQAATKVKNAYPDWWVQATTLLSD